MDERKFIERAEARMLERGRLTLYQITEYSHHYSPGLASGSGVPGAVISHKIHLYLIRNARGELIGVKNETFYAEMRELLADAPDLLLRIENNELKFKHLKTIIQEYNRRSH